METLNYDDFKPINEGLFCEKIFGPQEDWKCGCKKYKHLQRKLSPLKETNICKKCNVEITKSNIRNYRMGY
jgi:DNA-directed RNA polymerase subunit beta'